MNKIRQIKKTTDVATELLTITEFKVWAQIDGTDHDANLTILIKQVRETIEKKTGLGIGTQTLEVIADLCGYPFELPRGPVQTVTSIYEKVTSSDWGSILVEDTDYDLDLNDFTEIRDYGQGRFKFAYSTGYTTNLPAGLKLLWQKLVLAHFEARSDSGLANIKALENELKQYMRPINLL